MNFQVTVLKILVSYPDEFADDAAVVSPFAGLDAGGHRPGRDRDHNLVMRYRRRFTLAGLQSGARICQMISGTTITSMP